MVKRVYLPDLTVEQVLNSRLNYIKYGGRVPRVIQLSGDDLKELETPECCPGVDVDEQIKRCAHDFDKNSANRINFFWNTKYRSIVLDHIRTSDCKLTLRENLLVPHLSCIEFKRKRTREKNRAYRAKVRTFSEAMIKDEESAKKVCMNGHITLSKLAEHTNLSKTTNNSTKTEPKAFRFIYEDFTSKPPKYSMQPPPPQPGTASLACYKDMIRQFKPLNVRIYNPTQLSQESSQELSAEEDTMSNTSDTTFDASLMNNKNHSRTNSTASTASTVSTVSATSTASTASTQTECSMLSPHPSPNEVLVPPKAYIQAPVVCNPNPQYQTFLSDSETPSLAESSSISSDCSSPSPKDILPSSPVSLNGCKLPLITEDVQKILEALEALKQGRC